MTRRQFLGASALSLVTQRLRTAAPPVSSISVTAAGSFDRTMEEFMRERAIPGGALAVVKDRRLVHARGFGWANREKRIPVRAASLFRIASLSKPITAVAVLKLVEIGKLNLEVQALPMLKLKPARASGATPDPRLEQITIRQLLQHTAGWDREKSFDPMFRPDEIANTVGTRAPAGPNAIIRYMLGRPLDFDPGARFAYSNFGYSVLGRVIEQVTGRTYEKFVQTKVLAPMGIQRMRLGRSRESGRANGEVTYYMPDGATSPSVFSNPNKKVPAPYGGFYLEAMDAHGGWLSSVIDLARFMASLGPGANLFLKPESMRTLIAPPPAPAWRKPDGTLEEAFYGCGWMVRPKSGSEKVNLWHTGSLPGTYTLMARRWDGISYVALFNQRSPDWQTRDEAIDPLLYKAADAVTDWPANDLFEKGDTTRAR